ncbi:hypothetical protein [Paenirhodobacter sp. CAU 1674]|uniref:hypothetical protein n=1 Tax=Paenirhodobacter sp. CAU 1674 TaxID=3032596 RepID=UPI0023DB206E|nr:hypothetical protein [Paenirhodobacter sp. CAU 1674]MDF2140824.1 hypothetical protein [Paenirhodobacter sp. CAU 1674]
MRVLICCETSGVMRRAFAARGHDAWSVDLLPAEDGSNRHITGDLRDHLADGWDLLTVMHPPCTRLCNSGVRWLTEPSKRLPETYAAHERAAFARMSRDERLAFLWYDLQRGVDLFTACWRAPVPRVAIENPVMNPHARARLPADLPRPQIVQPWWFGEPFFKATGFYLRGLPRLTETNRLTPPCPGTEAHKQWSAVHRAAPGPDRWKIRSRTFEGVANACADKWGWHAQQQEAKHG